MAKKEPTGHHVGKRHLDPKHQRGEWWPKRRGEAAEDPTDAKDLPKGVGGRRLGRGPGRTAKGVVWAGIITGLAAIAETAGRWPA